jgi:hypothetical protein
MVGFWPKAAKGFPMAPAAAYGFAAELDGSADDTGGGIAAAGFKAARGFAIAGAAGAAGAAVFCLAISASAFRILEVSGAAPPLGG